MKYIVKVFNDVITETATGYLFRIAAMYGNPEYRISIPKEDVQVEEVLKDTSVLSIEYNKFFPYVHTHKQIMGLTILGVRKDEEDNDVQ